MERLSLEELTDELKKIIRQLEEKAEATPGITIIDKRDFDGFNYAIAVRHGENIWVVYTTRHYLRISRCLRGDDSCLIAFRVTTHIPFDSVTVNEMGDYFNPYLDTVQSTKVRIEKELYGLRLIDLPFFQSWNFRKNSRQYTCYFYFFILSSILFSFSIIVIMIWTAFSNSSFLRT